ncbi:MAG TPA: PIG-L family deacetylase [Candidatus Acidoferrales bacterium]|nr:PIG-L family deacetylase [Candidatus Acidoferrales bacterium]
MKRRLLFGVLMLGVLVGTIGGQTTDQPTKSQLVPPVTQVPPVGHSPRMLIVVAHPDDESCFAATVYEITHNLGGTVEQMVITNGEGGYRYSLLAEAYYGVKLTDEAVGRAVLPDIRKQELLNSGRIMGVSRHYFLDEPDKQYTQDVDEVLTQHWNDGVVEPAILRRLEDGHYDFVLTLFPTPDTHGAHKAATLSAISAVQKMKSEHPVVLGCQDSSSKQEKQPDWTGYKSPAHPLTVGTTHYTLDRTVKFGFRNSLDYSIIVNWVIAEHKSQGLFQMGVGHFDRENFAVLESGARDAEGRTAQLFKLLADHMPK